MPVPSAARVRQQVDLDPCQKELMRRNHVRATVPFESGEAWIGEVVSSDTASPVHFL